MGGRGEGREEEREGRREGRERREEGRRERREYGRSNRYKAIKVHGCLYLHMFDNDLIEDHLGQESDKSHCSVHQYL